MNGVLFFRKKWVLTLVLAAATVPVHGVKKCFSIPDERLSETCAALAITPTTACANGQPDFTTIGAVSLVQAQADRKARCDDPHYRLNQCPNDPREADPCERDGPSLTEHCGGDEILCESDEQCATRLICWSRCFPCQTEEVCNTLVEIGIVASKGNTACVSQNRCYQVDETRAGSVCNGVTPGRICDLHRPDLRFVTEEYIDKSKEEWLAKCSADRTEEYRKEECPNDPTAARPCSEVYPEPTKEYLCGAIGKGDSSGNECVTSMDCPPILRECWSTCFPCKSRAVCEQRVSRGEVAPEGITECNHAGAGPRAAFLALLVAALVAFL